MLGTKPAGEDTTKVVLLTLTNVHSTPPRVTVKLAPKLWASSKDSGKKSPVKVT